MQSQFYYFHLMQQGIFEPIFKKKIKTSLSILCLDLIIMRLTDLDVEKFSGQFGHNIVCMKLNNYFGIIFNINKDKTFFHYFNGRK